MGGPCQRGSTSSIAIVLGVVVTACGCYRTWDIPTRQVRQLNGFQREDVRQLSDGEGGTVPFDGDTQLDFGRDPTGQERKGTFRSERIDTDTFVGSRRVGGESLVVDLTKVERATAGLDALRRPRALRAPPPARVCSRPMRAVRIQRYGGPEVLSLDDVPEPGPLGPGDVLVRVHAASVNPIDTKIRAGWQRGAVRLRLPWILGLDVAGVVEAVGPGVTRFRAGDPVMASPTHRRPGTWAELVVIDEAALAPKPARWSFVEAATLPLVGLTAWACLVDRAKLRPGQRVLVQAGAGGVGTVAIQLAKSLGAWVATTASARNEELVRSLGADLVVDHTTARFEDRVEQLDVVLESLGGEVLERSVRVLRRGGVLTSIMSGLPESTKRWGPNLGVVATGLRLGWLALRARLSAGVRVYPVVRKCDGVALAELGKLADAGAIRPIVQEVFPLERIADAHRALETGRTRGKLAIRVLGD